MSSSGIIIRLVIPRKKIRITFSIRRFCLPISVSVNIVSGDTCMSVFMIVLLLLTNAFDD